MKGLRQLVIGSAVGGLIGGAGFVGVDALLPQHGLAQRAVGINITDMSSLADKWVKITDMSSLADKWVRVLGRCRGRGQTYVKLTDMSSLADEWWKVTDSASLSDMDICLSGDIEEWFEHAD